MRGYTHRELYQFFLVSDKVRHAVTETTLKAEVGADKSDRLFDLLHKRLGHPSINVVNSVLKTCNLSVSNKKREFVCSACQQGKAHKLPFPNSTTKYKTPFELIVSDMWGPAIIACGNSWYYVAFVDIFSRFTWIYLIQQKSQTIECFVKFQQMIKVQFGKDIKQVQTDSGGEYRPFTVLLAKQGVLHRVTCPHTSEQNGIVERKHRYVAEVGLTLLA